MAIIVIVDDDPTIRLIAGEMLRHEDYAVVEASDGDEALGVVAILPVDLVVLDMLMPNKDGLETISELKASHPEVRILAISSGGRMDSGMLLRTALAFGADDALPKPLHADTLARTVARLLAAPAQQWPAARAEAPTG
ncbi:MAG: CheY-like chemotaxis protein [Brevundimonas sp.]|jgi:CheY-like chemotaxis protein|uniref:response regulator n=1 Tax=Brevundimonas sp. TaxID=1871086 RepID=UPI00248800BA|nr:response regulator [Brevundimonas sp.]MDI1282351.1 response regulator [Brevundimonas sp.]